MPFLSKNARRISLWVLTGIVVVLAAVGGAYQIWLSTIHVVIPNQIYRSAQLTSPLLHHYIRTKNIKTVINLRGAQPKSAWYKKELAITSELGATHYDINMVSHQAPNKEQLRMLVYLLLYAKPPFLVHCLGGADRSGLASAVALILDKNASLPESKQQISIKHLVFSPTSTGKLTFPHYQRWLATNHLPHNRDNFLKWVCSPNPIEQTVHYDYIETMLQYNPCSSPQLSLARAQAH